MSSETLVERAIRVLDLGQWHCENGNTDRFRDEVESFVRDDGGMALLLLDAELRTQKQCYEEVLSAFLASVCMLPPELLWELRVLILTSYLTHESANARLEAADGLEWMGCRHAARYIRRAAEAETYPTIGETLLRIADNLSNIDAGGPT